ELHILVLGELVALDDVLARDDHLFLDAYVLLLQARAACLVQHVEVDSLARLGGRIELHRDGNHAEGDGQRRNRSRSHACLPIYWNLSGERIVIQRDFPRHLPPSNADSRPYFRVRASLQRSPVSARRSAAFVRRKSRGCALASSSQVSGMETGPPGA